MTGWAGQLTEDEIMAHPDVNRIVEKPLKVTRLLEIVAQEVKGAVDEAAFAGRVDGIDLLEYIQVLLLTGKPAIVAGARCVYLTHVAYGAWYSSIKDGFVMQSAAAWRVKRRSIDA